MSVDASELPKSEIQLSAIDKLLEGADVDKTKAYGILLELNEKNGDSVEILWRLAKACHVMSSMHGAKGDNDKRAELIQKGVDYASKAISIDDNSANGHKWYAICVGARGQFMGTKEKIKGGYIFKEHVEKAIALNGSDPTLYNLLARFELEVSSLSSMERRLASWIFAEVPEGSVDEAIKGFLKTEELNPKPWKENKFLLAKAYILKGEYGMALSWLDKALAVPAVTSEEKSFDEQIKKLIYKYESYRQ